MKNRFKALLILLLGATTSFAQMNYSFNTSTTNFTPITGGSTPFLSGNGVDPLSDEGFVNNIQIGFSFRYNGNNTFSEVSISTNGFISFSELTDAHVVNNLTDGALGERPIIAPLWDDIDLQNTTNLRYSTAGASPNRVFTVQWLNAKWGFGASSECVSFQVKLYETSNWIQFLYRQESGFPASPSASVGLASNSTGSNNFLSLSNLTNSPNVSLSSEIAAIATKPASNQSYIFKPGTLPVNFASFNVTKEKGTHLLQWQTANEVNNAGFEVQRSANGTEFATISQVQSKAVGGNSSTMLQYYNSDIKPLEGINYYRIKQIDKDGSVHYSAIVSIKNNTVGTASLSLYPNPVKNKLNVQLNNVEADDVTVTVFNVYGQQLIVTKNTITSSNNVIGVDVSQLTTGIYTVRIFNSKTNSYLTQRFVK